MSKGFRVLLQIFQVLSLLGALLFLTMTLLEAYADWGLTEEEVRFGPFWAVTCGVLAIAFSPALWSLHRGGGSAGAAAPVVGSYDRVNEQPPPPPQPQQPPHPGGGSSFEPISTDRAPAPPASSYGQPSGPNFGAQPSGGMPPTSSPQGETPWGGNR